MKLYHFSRLIRKYSVSFTLRQKKGGGFVSGRWQDGTEVSTEMRGAIVPLSDRKVYGSGGTYTTQDRELVLTAPLNGVLSEFTVLYDGNVYAIEEGRNYEAYADVAVYTLKWQSKRGVGDNA